jgi:dTDP-4-amino-4,6-dideoxygalactose transaminase
LVTGESKQPAIPPAGLQREWLEIGDELRAALERVLASGHFILGTEVAQFETLFAEYCGTTAAVGMASGTDALILALTAAGIGTGDEVITTTLTSGATATAIARTGATPVLVDIDPDNLNLDPAAVEAAMTGRTRAIVPVHLYGRPAPLARLREVCRGHGLKLIEDCAQAAGATSNPGRVGSHGDLGCFSFYPTKNLGAFGDGGMVVSSDPELIERLRLLRTYGWKPRDFSLTLGFNSRLDELQAALLAVKLRHLDAWNRRRSELAARYGKGLQHIEGVAAPTPEPGHVWHLYVVRVTKRERVRECLTKLGVSTGIHYPVPIHRQPAFAKFGEGRSFPNAEAACEEILSLPMFPQLRDDEVDRVVEAVATSVG